MAKTTKETKGGKKGGKGEHDPVVGKKVANNAIKALVDAIFGYKADINEDALNAIRESCERFLRYTISKMPNNSDGYEGLSNLLRLDRLKKARLMKARGVKDTRNKVNQEKKNKGGFK